ncbi:hypothetical protein J7M23_08420 [Candidatus Sumerlaeota bacterium]|nr:hypothetical protein [Candidatus Sumerlaeota bacterium]
MVKHRIVLAIVILLLCTITQWVSANDKCSTESLLSLLPKNNEIKNWIMKESPHFFFAHNLWKYINGAAPRYLKYDFRCVVTVEYTNLTTSSLTILVDIYDMGLLDNAFGMFAAERSPNYHFIDIGAEAYAEMPVLNFFKDRYYVKLTAYTLDKSVQKSLIRFAQVIESNIKGEARLPAPVYLFPEKDLIPHSQRFFLRDFLNIKGLNNWFTAEYRVNRKQMTLFLHPCKQNIPAVEMKNIDAILLKHGWLRSGQFSYTAHKANKVLVIKPGKSYIYGGMTAKTNEPLLRKKLKNLQQIILKIH